MRRGCTLAAYTMRLFLLVPLLLMAGRLSAQRTICTLKKGHVAFTSDAPMERITAANDATEGVLDIHERDFAVRVPMRWFKGFNSPLQQEHFYENYVRTGDFPNAIFEGRIIEAVDLSVQGTYSVRAKGRLTIHGVPQERIIPCAITVDAGGIRVTSAFDVALADHGIRIPRVVHQKLAPETRVEVDLRFEPPAER